MGRSSGSLLLVAAVIVVAGCGGDDEQDDVRAQVDAFRSALVDGDGAAACDLMTTQAQDVYANIGKSGTCEGGFEQVTKALDPKDYESEIETDDVSIDGDRATVSPGGGEAPIALVKSGDEWLIDAPGS